MPSLKRGQRVGEESREHARLEIAHDEMSGGAVARRHIINYGASVCVYLRCSDVVPYVVVVFTADNALEDASFHLISGLKHTLDPLLETPVIL